MIDRSNPDDALELHNAEQDDERDQAQNVASEARYKDAEASPLDSVKRDDGGLDDDSTQDLIDKMRDMEQSGRIDMGAFAGEPNHDDEDETYGEAAEADDS